MRIFHQTIICPLLVAVATLVSTALFADVYKVVDQDGNIAYTDRPSADPDTVSFEKLPPLNKMPAITAPIDDELVEPTQEQAFAGYSRGIILSPENDSIIPHSQTSLLIQLAMTPQLQPGHTVQFLLDGVPQGSAIAAIAHKIDNVERGTHSLGARVFDAGGKPLISIAPVKVHVKRNFKRK